MNVQGGQGQTGGPPSFPFLPGFNPAMFGLHNAGPHPHHCHHRQNRHHRHQHSHSHHHATIIVINRTVVKNDKILFSRSWRITIIVTIIIVNIIVTIIIVNIIVATINNIFNLVIVITITAIIVIIKNDPIFFCRS